jgi:hypothetical protein
MHDMQLWPAPCGYWMLKLALNIGNIYIQMANPPGYWVSYNHTISKTGLVHDARKSRAAYASHLGSRQTIKFPIKATNNQKSTAHSGACLKKILTVTCKF